MKKKHTHLDYDSENLAFPEVHIETDKTSQPETNDDDSGSSADVVTENLAFPEIKIKRTKNKK